MSTESYLLIPALGRTYSLGTLYDARTEEFSECIFKDSIPDKFINTSQTPFTFTEMSYTNNLHDKFRLFDIKAELSMSLLCGLFTAGGSATYLMDEKKSARDTEGAMVFKTTTVFESLQIYFEGLRTLYHIEALSQSRATHIVTGVKWGANFAIKFNEKFSESHRKETTSGDLSLAFDKLKLIFSGSGLADVHNDGKEENEISDFSMQLYGDIHMNVVFPKNFKEIQQIIKNVPVEISKNNGGKGVEIEYTLAPLSPLRKYLKPDIIQNQFLHKLDESISLEVVKIFNDISLVEQRLNDLEEDLKNFPMCTFEKSRDDLAQLKSKFLDAKDELQKEAKEAIVKMRSGSENGNLTDFSKILEKYHKNEYSLGNVTTKLAQFKEASAKIDLFKTIQKFNSDIDYIGRDGSGSLELKLMNKNLRGKIVYVLYMKTEFRKNDPVSWGSHSHLFLSTLNQPFNKLIVVDCDFDLDPECQNIQRTIIKQIYNWKVTIEDVYAELHKGGDVPQNQIEIKALGRTAQLGHLYDARKDSFLQSSFIKQEYPPSILNLTKSNDSEVCLIPKANFSGKCNALGVDTNQMFSIMADLYSLGRSGRYISYNGTSTSSAEDTRMCSSILYSLLLDEQAINMQNNKFPESVNIDSVMEPTGAHNDDNSAGTTHFVSKIQLGFNTIFSLEFPQDGILNQNSTTDHNLYFEKQARIFKQILRRTTLKLYSYSPPAPSVVDKPQKGKGSGGSEEQAKGEILRMDDVEELDPSIVFRVFSDIHSESQTFPETIQGRQNLLDYFNKKFFPQLAQQKQGQGHPIIYVLTPLENLRKSCGLIRPPKAIPPFQTITSSNLDIKSTDLKTLFENITGAEVAIQNLSSKLEEYPRCWTDKDISDLNQIKQEFNSNFADFKKELKNLTLQFRSSVNNKQGESVKFASVLEKYEKLGQFGKDGFYLELEKMSLLTSKLKLCEHVKFHPRMEYIGRGSSRKFDQLFTEENKNCKTSEKIFLLYYKAVWMKEKATVWLSASQRFFETLRGGTDNGDLYRRFVVDCDFHQYNSQNVTQPTIYEFKNGQLIVEGGEQGETAQRITELYKRLVKRIGKVEEKLDMQSDDTL